MDQIEEFVDERQKSWCVHCGGWIGARESNRDHVPSKSLLNNPLPTNLPVIEVCKKCNESFSQDEEYMMVLLSCVLTGSTVPEEQLNPKARGSLSNSPKLRAQLERAKIETVNFFGEKEILWEPETERTERVILKNARGHAFFEYGEPMLQDPTHIWSVPLESLSPEDQNEFECINLGGMLPEVGSRMLTRVITGQDMSGDWVIVQDNMYRYGVAQRGIVLVRSVLCEYLATEVYWGS